MTLSNYPNQMDLFQVKKNAQFSGDPVGDYVMADDVNALQDAIIAIENALGIQPQGAKQTLSDRINVIENSGTLMVPSFCVYFGNPSLVNNSQSLDESVEYFQRYDHLVFDEAYIQDTNTKVIIDKLKSSQVIQVYGVIDCGVNTTNYSISTIQTKINQWMSQGVQGIYCKNFSFDYQVSRERQNTILDSIHQYGLKAILTGEDPVYLFTDAQDDTYNPNWIKPTIQRGDIYHYERFAVDTSLTNDYIAINLIMNKLQQLYNYRATLGIRIFATALIQSVEIPAEAQQKYEYAHALAMLCSLDGYYALVEGYSATNNIIKDYRWLSVVGQWYNQNPYIRYSGSTYSRQVGFGTLSIDESNHTYNYNGVFFPASILNIQTNTLDGNVLKDNSISDNKISNYNGNRLIQSINSASESDKIDIGKIEVISQSDIQGAVPADKIAANVVTALNLYAGQMTVGSATISNAVIGTLSADNMTANVIHAINLYAENMDTESAHINEAVIGELSAGHISASVVEAINLYTQTMDAESATIDEAAIGTLNAGKIAAGDIATDRIRANVVNAINAYAQNMTVGDATIATAAIGSLTVDNMKAGVIDAINANISGSATINGAIIQEATINGASIMEGTITDALILSLDAGKIISGTLDTNKVTVQGPNGYLRLTGNRLQVFDDQAIPVERVSIGDVDNDGSAYGLRVRGVDGTTILYDENGVYNEGITDGAVTNPKIADDSIDNRVITVDAVNAENITSDAIITRHIQANQITGDKIAVNAITADKAIIANGAINTAQIQDLAVTNAKIANLNADKINAGKVLAQYVEIGNGTTFAGGYDPSENDSQLRTDLRLAAPLPDRITMNDAGIRIDTDIDDKYVSLDYRGIYIKNGAIQIDGGLPADQVNVEIGGRNLLIEATLTQDQTIDASGSIQSIPLNFTTDYIELIPGKSYTISTNGRSNNITIAFYTLTKSFIYLRSITDSVYTFNCPENTYYIIFSSDNWASGYFMVENSNKPSNWSLSPEDQINKDQSYSGVKINDNGFSAINGSSTVTMNSTDGFKITNGASTLLQATTGGSLTVAGAITANSGYIGGTSGFTITNSGTPKMYSGGKTSYNSGTNGVYIGTDGIGLGTGNFYVTSAGALTATNANITGTINATGGTFNNVTIGSTATIGGTSASTLITNANNGNTAKSTIDGNKSIWDRANNINSNGTFNTSKLSGTLTDSQIVSSGNWNGAKGTVDGWKMSGKTTINGGMIEADTITAAQINVGTLSALTADLGNVIAGTINGVTINGSVLNQSYSTSSNGHSINVSSTINNGIINHVSGYATEDVNVWKWDYKLDYNIIQSKTLYTGHSLFLGNVTYMDLSSGSRAMATGNLWADYIGTGSLSTGYLIVSDDSSDLASHNGGAKIDGKTYIRGGSGTWDDPQLTLSLGDADTGFDWSSDGFFSIKNNGQTTAQFASDTSVYFNKDVNANNGSIHSQNMELRWNAGTPFLDFSNDSSSDYDVRLILDQDDRLTVAGGSLHTEWNVQSDGNLICNGNIASGGMIDLTTGWGANVVIQDGWLRRSASATKYKEAISYSDTTNDYAERILELNPVTWYDKSSNEAMAKAIETGVPQEKFEHMFIQKHHGLIAEDLVNVGLEGFVSYGIPDELGNREVEGIEYSYLWTLLIPVIKDMKQKYEREIASLKEDGQSLRDSLNDVMIRLADLEEKQGL